MMIFYFINKSIADKFGLLYPSINVVRPIILSCL